MRLHQASLANRLGKQLAKPLSWLACARGIYPLVRMTDAYLNFLIGKGSGTGWDLREEVRGAVLRIRRPRPVVFDVGANVGSWTQNLLQLVPGAKVYMFDPSPGCQAAIREKNLPGVAIIPCALGETPGEMLYYTSSPTDGSASLHPRRDTPFETFNYRQMIVPVRTLDEIIETEKIDFVDFMKMDIEGHELFALKGARRALAAGKIRALSFEFGCGNVNSRTFFRDFWDLLGAADFAIYRITPGGKNILVADYYEDAEYFRGATNYIAELKSNK
ncbi:MAG: FkbM family methyltransferase [Verrucomicrobiota bacterium]